MQLALPGQTDPLYLLAAEALSLGPLRPSAAHVDAATLASGTAPTRTPALSFRGPMFRHASRAGVTDCSQGCRCGPAARAEMCPMMAAPRKAHGTMHAGSPPAAALLRPSLPPIAGGTLVRRGCGVAPSCHSAIPMRKQPLSPIRGHPYWDVGQLRGVSASAGTCHCIRICARIESMLSQGCLDKALRGGVLRA